MNLNLKFIEAQQPSFLRDAGGDWRYRIERLQFGASGISYNGLLHLVHPPMYVQHEGVKVEPFLIFNLKHFYLKIHFLIIPWENVISLFCTTHGKPQIYLNPVIYSKQFLFDYLF